MNKKEFAGVVAILVLAVLTAVFYMKESAYLDNTMTVAGTVTDIRSERVTTNKGAQYSTNVKAVMSYHVNGEEFKADSRFFGVPRWKKGDALTVHYLPEDPSVARAGRVDEAYLCTLVFGSWFVLCVLFFSAGQLFKRLQQKSGSTGTHRA